MIKRDIPPNVWAALLEAIREIKKLSPANDKTDKLKEAARNDMGTSRRM